MDIRRFTVDIPEHVLTDLNDRLARTRWPDEVEGARWEYGVDRAWLLWSIGLALCAGLYVFRDY